MKEHHKIYALWGCGGLLIFASLFLLFIEKPQVSYENQNAVIPYNPFTEVEVSAKSAIVYDPDQNKILYEKNAYEPRPLASVAKLMTAYTATKLMDDEDIVSIDPQDLASEGDSGLFAYEDWHFKDLRDVMLVTSSNDAAEAIARTATTSFIDYMNTFSIESGWTSFSFKNPSGLDINNIVPTAFGSAYHVALLFKSLLHEYPQVLEGTREPAITRSPLGGIMRTFSNTNLTVNDVPTMLGSKTGYTNAAGGNLAIAYNVGLKTSVIIVVLGSYDQDTRFADVMKLAKTTEEYLKTINDN